MLDSNSDIGIVGSSKWLYEIDHRNYKLLKTYCQQWSIPYNFVDEIDWDNRTNNMKLDPPFYLSENPQINLVH